MNMQCGETTAENIMACSLSVNPSHSDKLTFVLPSRSGVRPLQPARDQVCSQTKAAERDSAQPSEQQ
jgi:hypothetical protein